MIFNRIVRATGASLDFSAQNREVLPLCGFCKEIVNTKVKITPYMFFHLMGFDYKNVLNLF